MTGEDRLIYEETADILYDMRKEYQPDDVSYIALSTAIGLLEKATHWRE